MQLTAKVPTVIYLAVITWKANSGGSEDNPGSNGSIMPGVDELFKSMIMSDNIRVVEEKVEGDASGDVVKAEYILHL